MKNRIIALLIVFCMAISLLPMQILADTTGTTATTIASVADQAVESGVPHVITWTATSDGVLHIDAAAYASGVIYTAYELDIYSDSSSQEPLYDGVPQTPGDKWVTPENDFAVEEGQYCVISLYARKNYADTAGTVTADVLFYSDAATLAERLWDDVYNEANPFTEPGSYKVDLNTGAHWTMFQFTPQEIGIFTISVDQGVCGYSGAGSHYTYVPADPASSFEREVKSVGNSVIFSVQSDDPNVTVTIEKTGDSQGIVETVYIPWETVHTPDAALVGMPEDVTQVDITQEHTAVKVSDSDYRLDTADGPRLYVDLSHSAINFSLMFGDYGALTLRGSYQGENYDFKPTMAEYRAVMQTTYKYPLTTDLIAFLQGYGAGAGCWYDEKLSELPEVLDGTAKTPWMFSVYSAPVHQDESLSIINNGISTDAYIGAQAILNPVATANYDDVYVYVTINGVTTELRENIMEDYPGYYGFEMKVGATDMAETMTWVTYGMKDGLLYEGVPFEWSVKQIAVDRLNKLNVDGASEVNMKRAIAFANLLNYGAKSQTALNLNAGNLATAGLDQKHLDLIIEEDPVIEDTSSITSTGLTGATYLTRGVSVGSTTEMQIIFLFPSSDVSNYEFHFKYNGETFKYAIEADMLAGEINGSYAYYYIFDQITANHLREKVEVTVCNKTTGEAVSETCSVSIVDICKDRLASTDANIVAAVKAMVNYGDAAKAYFDANAAQTN